MKKLLIAALALFTLNGSFAQDIRGGIKVGSNLSTLTGLNSGDSYVSYSSKMKFGFHIGGFVDFAFNERVSLQPELLYSTQGTKFVTLVTVYSITSGYINVPVLLKINIIKGFSTEIGPQIGFLVSADVNSKNVKKNYNTLDLTAVVGLSYTFAEHFVVSARYGLGITNVYKEDPEEIHKNSVIQLGVGYKF